MNDFSLTLYNTQDFVYIKKLLKAFSYPFKTIYLQYMYMYLVKWCIC